MSLMSRQKQYKESGRHILKEREKGQMERVRETERKIEIDRQTDRQTKKEKQTERQTENVR